MARRHYGSRDCRPLRELRCLQKFFLKRNKLILALPITTLKFLLYDDGSPITDIDLEIYFFAQHRLILKFSLNHKLYSKQDLTIVEIETLSCWDIIETFQRSGVAVPFKELTATERFIEIVFYILSLQEAPYRRPNMILAISPNSPISPKNLRNFTILGFNFFQCQSPKLRRCLRFLLQITQSASWMTTYSKIKFPKSTFLNFHFIAFCGVRDSTDFGI
jgi:hypothetical protein